jgi:dienelactone hydrolase
MATLNRPLHTRRSGFAMLLVGGFLSACGGGGDDAAGIPPAVGTLNISACAIAEGQSTCQATIAWTTSNATMPSVAAAGATLSNQPSGNVSISVNTAAVQVVLADGMRTLDQRTVQGACVSASAWDGSACRSFATRSVVRAPTPFVEIGMAIELEVVLFTPPGPGPFPTVMFNHGSTGNGSDPSLFTVTWTSESIAQFFARRGWLVAFPQRRGRGASDGLYDEGFTLNRSGYSCEAAIALAGATRALADLDAAVDYLRGRPEVDSTRMLAAGTSRGGILAVAHLARRPEVYRGAVNFVGGWLGEGCGDFASVNRTLFEQGAAFQGPSLWLYATNDSFYSLDHSRANFAAFTAVGGQGTLEIFSRASGLNGHFLVNDSALWGDELAAWLEQAIGP